MSYTPPLPVTPMPYVPTPILSPTATCPILGVVQQPLDPGPLEGFSLDTYTQPTVPPSKPTRAVYAQEFAQGIPGGVACRTALLTLSGCAIQQVDQDDHSLFQSVALLLLDEPSLERMNAQAERLQNLTTSQLQSLIGQAVKASAEFAPAQGLIYGQLLKDRLANLGTQIIELQALAAETPQLTTIIAQARESLKAGKSPREILADSTVSENWIRILRSITTGWWSKIGSESPESEAFRIFRSALRRHGVEQDDQAILHQYSQKMSSFKDGFPGGGAEIHALSQALGRTIHVVNVRQFEEGQFLLPPDRPQDDLYLICGISPDHYDALYLPDRIPMSVVAEMKDESRQYIPYSLLCGTAAEPPLPGPVLEYIDPWANPFHLVQPITAEALAETLPQNHRYKADIQSLHGCSIQKVLGDGHCLFRSIAVLLMKDSVLDVLQHYLEEFQCASPKMPLNELFERTRALLHINQPPGKILSSSTVLSEAWITSLRNLAVNWWTRAFFNSPDSGFVRTFIASERARGNMDDEETIFAQYMSTMSTYEQASWGGEPEIVGLQQALGINIHVIDLQTPKNQRQDGALLPATLSVTDLYLLRSSGPDHYDALYIPGQLPQ